MKVLIVDDDPLTRLALQRLLIRHFRCAVTECENGLDGLEQLERQSYSFVLLDNRMPVMSGVEALRVLRQSPRYGDVPVVMVSAVKDDESVAEIIRLGISDYLTKPLRPERVIQRLTSVIQSLGRKPHGWHDDGPTASPDARRPLVIAEGDQDFRHTFQTVLAPHYPVVEAPLGTTALKLCMNTPPAALFVGDELGVVTPDMLVHRLRGLPELDATRLFRIVVRTSEDALARVPPRFDGTLVRSYVPDSLLEQVRRLLCVTPGLDDVAGLFRALRKQLATAVEQTFGMMLGTDVTWAEGSAPAAGRQIEARILLTSPDGRLRLQVGLDCSAVAAVEITRRMLSMPAQGVSEDDCCASLAELANIVAGRLQAFLVDFGVPMRFSLPVASASAVAEPPIGDRVDRAVMYATAAAIALRVRVERLPGVVTAAA